MTVIEPGDTVSRMCFKLGCIKNPFECVYALDRYVRDYDCDGPYTKEEQNVTAEEQ